MCNEMVVKDAPHLKPVAVPLCEIIVLTLEWWYLQDNVVWWDLNDHFIENLLHLLLTGVVKNLKVSSAVYEAVQTGCWHMSDVNVILFADML